MCNECGSLCGQGSIRKGGRGGGAGPQTAPAATSTAPAHQTTGLRERGNDTSRSTGRSGRQNAATRRNMRREERVTVQGPVKEQQPDGMSHGLEGGLAGTPLLLWSLYGPRRRAENFVSSSPLGAGVGVLCCGAAPSPENPCDPTAEGGGPGSNLPPASARSRVIRWSRVLLS